MSSANTDTEGVPETPHPSDTPIGATHREKIYEFARDCTCEEAVLDQLDGLLSRETESEPPNIIRKHGTAVPRNRVGAAKHRPQAWYGQERSPRTYSLSQTRTGATSRTGVDGTGVDDTGVV
eukprot:178829-Prorocentrum_minimum.AAC.1